MMKCVSSKFIYVSSVALSVLFSSCGDKKTAEEAGNAEVGDRIEEIKEISKATISGLVDEKELSEVAGFAQYLPKSTELFFNAQDLRGLMQTARNSKLGRLLSEMAKAEGEDLDEAMSASEFQEFLNVAGEEVFFTMGDGSAQIMAMMGDLYGDYYQVYYYAIGKMLLDAVEGGDMMGDPAQLQQMILGMMKPIMNKYLEVDNYTMPRVLAGFKVSSDSDREKYTKFLRNLLERATEFRDSIPGMEIPFHLDSSEAYGGFHGVKINYSELFELMPDTPSKEFQMMGMDEEYMEKYKEAFKDYKITLLVGNYEDYVVLYLGDTSEGLEFMEDAGDSLLAHEEMGFLREYKDKDVMSVSYVSKEIYEEWERVSTFMEDFSAGINRLLADTEFFGDTKHIERLLNKLAKTERSVKSLNVPHRFGSVAYVDNGFKLDSFHGDSVMYDLDTRRKLAGIVMRDDALVSSSWVENEKSTRLVLSYLEDVVDLAYQVTKLVVEKGGEGDDFQEFSDFFKMLDSQFSDDLVALWESIKVGSQDGLGNESGLIIDLKGSLPRVPGVPTAALEKGVIPRLAWGYDVQDRSVLSESWDKISETNESIASKIERLTDIKLNFISPELVRKEGIDFWSYQLGITSDEANLALGVNNDFMFFTTSPVFVESFSEDYNEEGAAGGVDFVIRLAPLRKFTHQWIELYDEHGESIDPSFDKVEFDESIKIIHQIMDATSDLDGLNFSVKKMNGEVRSFLSIK